MRRSTRPTLRVILLQAHYAVCCSWRSVATGAVRSQLPLGAPCAGRNLANGPQAAWRVPPGSARPLHCASGSTRLTDACDWVGHTLVRQLAGRADGLRDGKEDVWGLLRASDTRLCLTQTEHGLGLRNRSGVASGLGGKALHDMTALRETVLAATACAGACAGGAPAGGAPPQLCALKQAARCPRLGLS